MPWKNYTEITQTGRRLQKTTANLMPRLNMGFGSLTRQATTNYKTQ